MPGSDESDEETTVLVRVLDIYRRESGAWN